MSYQFPMITGGFADDPCSSALSGTLSSILNGGEGWGEEVPLQFLPVFLWQRPLIGSDASFAPGGNPVVLPTPRVVFAAFRLRRPDPHPFQPGVGIQRHSSRGGIRAFRLGTSVGPTKLPCIPFGTGPFPVGTSAFRVGTCAFPLGMGWFQVGTCRFPVGICRRALGTIGFRAILSIFGVETGN